MHCVDVSAFMRHIAQSSSVIQCSKYGIMIKDTIEQYPISVYIQGKLSVSTKAWSNTGLLLDCGSETLCRTELVSLGSMPRWHNQVNIQQIWASCRYYALNVNCKSYLYVGHSAVVLCSGNSCPCLGRFGLLLSFPSGCPRWLPFCRGATFGGLAFGGSLSLCDFLPWRFCPIQ